VYCDHERIVVRMSRLTWVVPAVLLAFAVAAQSSSAQQAAPSAKPEKPDNTVVARVEGEAIYRRDVIAAFRTLPPQFQQRGLDATYEQVLEMLIERKMMTIFGRRENYANDPEVHARLKLAEDQIIREVYLDRLIGQYMTEERLRAHYNELVRKNPPQPEVRARHILVDSEAKAKEMIKRAKAGTDFAQLAAENSVGPSAQHGGDLGYFTVSEMVKPFADAAFKLNPGEISATPVKTEFGWHVIKLEDKRTRTVPPYEKVKGEIQRQVWAELGDSILRQFREQAAVERFSLDGTKKLPPLPQQSSSPGAPQQTAPK
jgi:peptidyl-prolyl cis-trans isomerase C